jgi:protoporphyrinogen oxidase
LTSRDSNGTVVIIGAGLAGLSAGRVLQDAGIPYVILESQERPGGVCRTETVGGFTFDYTGHLLHLAEGESRDLILDLIGEELQEHTRRASIYVEGTFVPYPIQAHFGFLPAPVAERCMEDLLTASHCPASSEMTFPEWSRAQFGDTLAEIFMIPYNRKLFVHPVEEMEVSWTSWSIPRPSMEEIRAIAAGGKAPSYGYNSTFLYPHRRGIEILPEALAARQEGYIKTAARVVEVNVGRKTVILEEGETIPYRLVISTAPLTDLIRISTGLSADLKRAADMLRYSTVLGICLGLDGPVLRDDHWIYFPGGDVPVYRVGFPSNFSRDTAPDGCGSLYAEIAYAPGSVPDADQVAEATVRSLKGLGIVGPSTKVMARLDLRIPCAYVFHDRYRAGHLDSILAGLRESGILSAGRYGAWEYSGMQEAVDWGLRAAREALS